MGVCKGQQTKFKKDATIQVANQILKKNFKTKVEIYNHLEELKKNLRREIRFLEFKKKKLCFLQSFEKKHNINYNRKRFVLERKLFDQKINNIRLEKKKHVHGMRQFVRFNDINRFFYPHGIDQTRELLRYKEKEKVFGNSLRVWEINSDQNPELDRVNMLVHLEQCRNTVMFLLKGLTDKKVQVRVNCTMEKPDFRNPSQSEKKRASFRSNYFVLLLDSDLDLVFHDMCEKILNSLAKYQKEGSGWRLFDIECIEVHEIKCNRLKSHGFASLRKWIALKKAIVNPKNDDDQCFKWAVCIALFGNNKQKEPGKITNYLREESLELDWNKVNFPSETKDIDQLEKIILT